MQVFIALKNKPRYSYEVNIQITSTHSPMQNKRVEKGTGTLSLAIFDLDNTLIGGDSDHLWGEFLVENQLVDASFYKQQNDLFYGQYQAGTLDINAYLEFALQALTAFSLDKLQSLHLEFMQTKITPIMLSKAQQLISKHQQQGDTLLIITATNSFVSTPIAQHLGIPNILASEAEMVDGQYTGRPTGVPCFQEGKVTRLNSWLDQHQMTLQGSYFYSDSANDIPLLNAVDHPVAVDPDSKLKKYAQDQGFPVITLRD